MKPLTIRLYIPSNYFLHLTDEHQLLFSQTDQGSIYIEFPMEDVQEDGLMDHFIIACAEASLIIPNPKYEVKEDTDLSCELLRLGKAKNFFNLLITIKYPLHHQEFHDIMLFQEIENTDEFYSFELLGDQTLFNITGA